MSLKRLLLLSGIATICFAALFFEDRRQPLVLLRLRNMARDAVARAGRTTPPNPALVFLAIDSDSVGLDPRPTLNSSMV
jgi:hypothetical protein